MVYWVIMQGGQHHLFYGGEHCKWSKQDSSFFFYGPLASIIKTCSNEDVRSESHQEINSELNEALVLWKLIGN